MNEDDLKRAESVQWTPYMDLYTICTCCDWLNPLTMRIIRDEPVIWLTQPNPTYSSVSLMTPTSNISIQTNSVQHTKTINKYIQISSAFSSPNTDINIKYYHILN